MNKREAGQKGGETTVLRYGSEYMAEIGRRGAEATWSKYSLVPVGTSEYAMVDKETGKVVAVR